MIMFCAPRPVFLSLGFLGDGDVVTQAIHDAQLLLRSHSSGGRERERDMEREREAGGKMVSKCPNHTISGSCIVCQDDHYRW